MQINRNTQINRTLNVPNQSGNIMKNEMENKPFNDVLSAKKEIEYEKINIGGDGHVYGLVNGSWQRVNPNYNHGDTKCGPDDIVVINNRLVKLGVNVFTRVGIDKRNFAMQEDAGFSNPPNGCALVPGTMVRLPDGTILKWTKNGVDYIPRRTGNLHENVKAEQDAAKIARIMNQFTKVANRQALGIGKVIGITKEETQIISKVLGAMGIDTYNDFYANGKKFTFDSASGEINYGLESSVDGKYRVRHVNAPTVRLKRSVERG